MSTGRRSPVVFAAFLGSLLLTTAAGFAGREFGRFFEELSTSHLVVRFLDDVYWIDASVRELLPFLGERIKSMPMSIVADAADTDPVIDGGARRLHKRWASCVWRVTKGKMTRALLITASPSCSLPQTSIHSRPFRCSSPCRARSSSG